MTDNIFSLLCCANCVKYGERICERRHVVKTLRGVYPQISSHFSCSQIYLKNSVKEKIREGELYNLLINHVAKLGRK